MGNIIEKVKTFFDYKISQIRTFFGYGISQKWRSEKYKELRKKLKEDIEDFKEEKGDISKYHPEKLKEYKEAYILTEYAQEILHFME
jgi:hypothetical protein